MNRVAAFVPNVLGVSPGQRIRIESWAQYLRQSGWQVDFYPFEDARLHEILYQPGQRPNKAARMASCYMRQWRTVRRRPPCDLLFIYREAALIGPALLERLSARWGVPVVYDLDDPVFLPYSSPANGWLSRLKCSRKTHTLFRLSDHVIAINHRIGEYASRFNSHVSVLPNCVDVGHYRPRPRPANAAARIVWIGSHSSMPNLATIADPLRRLQAGYPVTVRVVGVGRIDMPGVRLELRQWTARTEVAELQECDIGLVPLLDHPWNDWKFFLKTIQYMAVGLPVVARRMGSNKEVIQDGINGFLVDTHQEWYDRLRLLTEDGALRRRMGAAARATVEARYSAREQMGLVQTFFERAVREHRRRRRSCRGRAAC